MLVSTLVLVSASSEGSIPMEDGEDLWLIETDQGDGWTRVREEIVPLSHTQSWLLKALKRGFDEASFSLPVLNASSLHWYNISPKLTFCRFITS
jgi:hypothetical protein